jgi:hypothetical protein
MKYLLWLKFSERAAHRHSERADVWMPQGDGPLTAKQAERIAREIREDGITIKTLPVGTAPN